MSRCSGRGRWRRAGPSGEAFASAALVELGEPHQLRSVFCCERDWHRAEVVVTQVDDTATVLVTGDGDLEAAAAQACRFLALDVDAGGWPDIARRDPVIADTQERLPGLRPCGFHSPYEAAAGSVLSQRIRIVQAARLRDDLVRRHGDDGAFPAPQTLRELDLDLPGRKAEYLQAVAEAALEHRLGGASLRALDPQEAIRVVQEVKGLGPFAAELAVIRGANAPDAPPQHERRLEAEVADRYGPDRTLAEVSEAWRPLRAWAAVHLRALRRARRPSPTNCSATTAVNDFVMLPTRMRSRARSRRPVSTSTTPLAVARPPAKATAPGAPASTTRSSAARTP